MPNSSRPYVAASGSASGNEPAAGPVLVLGATGFLGRHVSRQLEALGVQQIRVGRTSRANVAAAVDLATAPQHEIDQLIAAAAPTAVINCSGAVGGNTTDLTRGNVVAVHALLSSLAWSAPTARLVQLGSSAEYGGVDTAAPMNEDTPTQPSSPYGFTKLAASELVLRARAQGSDAVVLRIFNVSGPDSPTSTMLGRLVEQLLNAGPETTIALDSLDGWRDYVDVRDVARAACLAAIGPRPLPGVINIGRGEAVQTRTWIQALLAASETGAKIIEQRDPRMTHKASAQAVAWQCADISTARDCLEWAPDIDLETSIRDTWNSARETAA